MGVVVWTGEDWMGRLAETRQQDGETDEAREVRTRWREDVAVVVAVVAAVWAKDAETT